MQIDGRIVYDSQLTGVFWDVQDVLLEDVERIEVIRGPGTSVWGSNAVTASSTSSPRGPRTPGGPSSRGPGRRRAGLFLGPLRRPNRQRLLLPHLRQVVRQRRLFLSRLPGRRRLAAGPGRLPHGLAGQRTEDTITFQGDYYNGYDGETARFPTFTPPDFSVVEPTRRHVSGDNLLAQLGGERGERSDWTAKVYYDQTQRHWFASEAGEDQNTFDFDFQYRFPLGQRNEVICGLEYRNVRDDTQPGVSIGMVPPEITTNLYSCFVQDQFTLKEKSLFPHGGVEVRARRFHRLRVGADDPAFADAQQAVFVVGCHLPGRPHAGNRRGNLAGVSPPISTSPPTFMLFLGNRNLLSEELIAYEAGIRGQPTEKLSWH